MPGRPALSPRGAGPGTTLTGGGGEAATGLGNFIRQHRPRILAAWEKAVRAQGAVSADSRPQLIDDVPALLERVAQALSAPPEEASAHVSGPSERHARERWKEGADVRQLATEYAVLRSTVLRLYGEEPGAALRVEEVVRFGELVDEALGRAVAHFAQRSARAEGSLAQLDALLDAAPMGVAFLDTHLAFVRANPALAALSGLSAEAHVGKRLEEVHPEAARRARPLLERVMRTGEGQCEVEFDTPSTGAERRWWLARCFPIRGHGGEPLGVGGVLLDMTERKRGEELQGFFSEVASALTESLDVEATGSRLAELVVERLADVCVLDIREEGGGLRRVAVAASPRLGARREAALKLRDFQPRPGPGSPVAGVLATGRPCLVEQVSPTFLDALATSPEHRAAIAGYGPRGGAHVPLVAHGRVLGVMTLASVHHPYARQDLDVAMVVADRAAVALDNARLHQELRASEARLKAIVDHSSAAVFVKDADGRFLLVNPAFCRIVGLEPEQVLGRTDADLFPREVAEAFHANDVEVLRRGVPQEFEEVVPQADGVHTYVSLKFLVPWHGERGKVLCGISTDISDRKRTEMELRRGAEVREHFLGVVSHDLRSPLNAISVSAGMLLRSEETPPGVVRMARRIAGSAERMRRMIEDLLDFTRVRLGSGLPLERRRCDLREVVRTVLDEAAVSQPTRELDLAVEGPVVGEFDADRLSQLVGNLVKNALDYSPPGTPVRVRLSGGDALVRLEVHNVGEPIPPELLPTLFEPFASARAEGRGVREGLGLGLSIAREIAQAHGGSIEVESTREAGTTFTVLLPRQLPAPPPEATLH